MPPSAWPTFYVVGPDEAVLARFVGAASVDQFRAFLDAGLAARAGGGSGADAHLLAAERAIATQELAAPEQALTAALARPYGVPAQHNAAGCGPGAELSP